MTTSHQPDLFHWFSETPHDTHSRAFNHIDLCDLNLQGNTLGRNIVEELLKTNSLNIEFKASKEVDQKLFQLNMNFKNSLAYSGFPSLALGFPIIKLKNGKTKKTKLTPLFLWPIALSNQEEIPLTWRISYDSKQQLRINLTLQRHLKEKFKIDLAKLTKSVFNDNRLTAISLSKICYELSNALGQKEDFFIENIQQIGDHKTNNIICAGAINNFFDPIVFPKKLAKTNQKKEASIQHSFGHSTLDVYQEKAFHNIWQHPHTQIIADKGTGRSTLLNYTLINGLSNGLSSLVIADSVGRITKIRNELSAQGLDHLLLDITNPDKDLNKVIQALTYKSTVPKEDFDPPYFKYLVSLCQRQKDRLDVSFQVLEQALFDKCTWSEIVGAYLNYNRVEKQELLDNQLNTKDFTFHPTEYLSLKEAVKTSEPLYRKFNNLYHPLSNLHPDIFLEKTSEAAKKYITDQLGLFYTEFDKLHHRYILKQQDYAKDLSNNKEVFFQEALLKIENIKDQIEDNRLLYGSEFEDSGLIQTGRLKVYGVFSGKHKNILQARNLINDSFKSLRSFLLQKSEHDFEITEHIDSKAISKIYDHLNELEDQVYRWRETMPEQLQETLQRLNSKSVDSSLDYAEQINELEYTLDMNIEALNTSGLYFQPLQNKMLTIPMRQQFIQDIIYQLQTTNNHLPDFDAFYEWQRYWLLLPEIHRKLLTALVKVNPKNWKLAFKSWYFYQRLKMDFHFKIPKDEKPLLAFEENIQKLRALLPTQIRNAWKQKSKEKLSGKVLSTLNLSEVFTQYIEPLSQQFPIIVISNQVAAQLIGTTHFNFDLAFLFKNGYGIENEECHLGHLARRSITFCEHLPGEQHHSGTKSHLYNVHKKTPHELFDFANHLIYQHQKNLAGFSENKTSPFQVKRVFGQFRNNINVREAEVIVNDFITLLSNAPGNSPRTAIVTSTIEQRDFIARKIMALKSSGLPEAAPLKNLDSKKLGIFHLGERRQDYYEALFFSPCIHSFPLAPSDFLTFLHSKNGYNQLADLMGSNVAKIYIYHSIPEEEISNHISYKSKKSTRLLASWIKYATASFEDQKAILDNFSNDKAPPNNKLIREIANELIPFIGKNRIRLNEKFKGVSIPLLILPPDENGKPIAILNDGAFDHENIRSYLWNIDFLKHLKAQGLVTVSVWSVNWFENPALEARRLASTILKMDKEPKIKQ